MGCLNSKSSTADGKGESKLPAKDMKKAAPANPAAAKKAPAPKPAEAAAPAKPATAPAKAEKAATPASEETPAPLPSAATKPDVVVPADTADTHHDEPADSSAPPSIIATTPPSVAKTSVNDMDASAEQVLEAPPSGGALAEIVRHQVEDYEAQHHGDDSKDSPQADEEAALAATDQDDSTVLAQDAEDIKEAARSYNASYKERMGHLRAPRSEDKAAPFIGFALADNIKEGVLVVDGVFHEGPAYQVGVDVDHELVSIAGRAAKTVLGTRELVSRFCHPGHITKFKFRNLKGITYEVPLYVLTAEKKYEGKPYFFDTTAHEITQSDRLKQSWRESSSPSP